MSDKPAESPLTPELEEKLSELDILRQSVDEAKSKEKAIYDQLLRLGAEFDNYRKRSELRVQDSRKSGKEDVLLDVITLADSLIHAEIASRNAKDVDSLKTGLSMVLSQFEKFLKDQGVEPIKSKGERLDPHIHDAISQEVNDDLDEGTILDEIQRGYSLNGRVIRPSKVKVSTKPKQEPQNVN